MAYCFVALWMLFASFIVSIHCSTWVVYFSIAALAITSIYLLFWWTRPSFLRPGGSLSWLVYKRLAPATRFGAVDWSVFGSLNEVAASFPHPFLSQRVVSLSFAL